jgi:hypothetical protein
MKTKIFIIVLGLLLVGSVTAKDKAQDKVVSEQWGVKAVIDEGEDIMYEQALNRDKARIVLFTAYVVDDYGDINHYLKLSNNDYIYYYIEYCSVNSTKVRFHFNWTGPEYYDYVTDWANGSTNTYYYYYISTNNNWEKGTYQLTIIAEQQKVASGGECVRTVVYRTY